MKHNSGNLFLTHINRPCVRDGGYISTEDMLETPTGRTSPFKFDNVHINLEKPEEKPTSKEQLKPRENNCNKDIGISSKEYSFEIRQDLDNSISSYIPGDQVNFLGQSSTESEEVNYMGNDFDNSEDNQNQHLLCIAIDLKDTVCINSHVNKLDNNSPMSSCRKDPESRNHNTNYIDGDTCAHFFSKDGISTKTMRNRCPKNETGTITDFREQETKDSVSSYDRAESMSSGEQATNDSVSFYVRTESMSSGEQATKDSVSSYVRAESMSSGEQATKDSVSSYVRAESMSFWEYETKYSASSYVRAESISSGEHATKDSVSSYVRAESTSSGEYATKDSISLCVCGGSTSSGKHTTKDSVSFYVRAESTSSGEEAIKDIVSSYVQAESISNSSSGGLNHNANHVDSETCFTSKCFSTNGLYSQNTCHRCNDYQTEIKNDSKERAIMNSVSSYVCADSSYISFGAFSDVTDKNYKKSILVRIY
jgi:hypothetical protein